MLKMAEQNGTREILSDTEKTEETKKSSDTIEANVNADDNTIAEDDKFCIKMEIQDHEVGVSDDGGSGSDTDCDYLDAETTEDDNICASNETDTNYTIKDADESSTNDKGSQLEENGSNFIIKPRAKYTMESPSQSVEMLIKPEFDPETNTVVLNKETKFNARFKPDTSSFQHHCMQCEDSFQWPYQLKRHTDIKHKGNYPYQCDICNKPFDRISGLKDHLLVHTDDRPFECEYCLKKFKMRGSLRKHIKDFHRENKLNFQCEYCTKVFKTKEALLSHFIVHNEEKNFECETCHKKFHRKNNLLEHMITHTTDKNFECPDCGLLFNRKYSLKIHSRNHMAVKPYRCEICPASFSQTHALKNHVRRHTGEKPYKCQYCDRSFAQLSTLQVHTKRHTGEKNFTCGICDRAFVIKRRLDEHVRVHTGAKPYQCDLCPYRATISSGLKLHMKTHMRQLQRQVAKESEDILKSGLKAQINTKSQEQPDENVTEAEEVINGELMEIIRKGALSDCTETNNGEDAGNDDDGLANSIDEIAKEIALTHGAGLKEIIEQAAAAGMPEVMTKALREITDKAVSALVGYSEAQAEDGTEKGHENKAVVIKKEINDDTVIEIVSDTDSEFESETDDDTDDNNDSNVIDTSLVKLEKDLPSIGGSSNISMIKLEPKHVNDKMNSFQQADDDCIVILDD